MMDILTAFIYPVLLGFLVLSIMLLGIPLRHRILFYLGASFPTGAGLCSLILFASYGVLPSGAKQNSLTISLAIIALLLGYRIFHHWKHSVRPRPPEPNVLIETNPSFLKMLPSALAFLLFALTLFTVLQFYTLSAPMDVFIYGRGDARFIWSLKAKFFFRAPEVWQNMFSTKIFWSHTDYPLLVPGILAWGWNWLGREAILWAPLVSLSFYLSCMWILVWYLSARISLSAGWIGGAFFLVLMPYIKNSICQYADVPVTFFITSCGLTLATALRLNRTRLFAVSGLLGGLAAWTKNEGLFFVGWSYVLLGSICFLKYYKKSTNPFRPLLWFSLGALLPLLAVIILKLFFGTHGEYLGSGRALQSYQGLLFAGWQKTFTILRAFYDEMASFDTWKGLWGFFVLGAVALGIRKDPRRDDFSWTLFWIVILINLGYLLIYHITPHNMIWHIRTSLDRLVLHSGLLALAFCFEGLGLYRPHLSRQDANSQDKPFS